MFQKLKKMFDTERKVLLLILLFAFVLRLYFQSHYFDDIDSVQFGMAMDHYSIADHTPHPPGYPVYILLGRISRLFFDNNLSALTFLSALFGSLLLIPVYLISEKLFNKKVALLSALLLSFVPTLLIYSEVAKSDVSALFFSTFVVYLLIRGFESDKFLYVASLMLGFITGIRLPDAVLLLTILVILLYMKKAKKFIICFSLFSIGVLLWLIPIIFITGFDMFLRVQTIQEDYVVTSSTMYYSGGFNLGSVVPTTITMVNMLIEGWSGAFVFFCVISILFILWTVKSIPKRDFYRHILNKKTIFLVAWLAPYFFFSLIYYPLDQPRFLLPMFPPLAIVFSVSITSLLGSISKVPIKSILTLVFLLSFMYMAYEAIILGNAIHTTVPPPVQAAEFIREHFSPTDTIVIGAEAYRHFEYYLPEFTVSRIKNQFGRRLSIKNITDFVLNNRTIVSEGGNSLPFKENYTKYSFLRDRKIFPFHNKVTLYEYHQDPSQSIIVVPNEGWSDLEEWGDTGTLFRWMGPQSALSIYSLNETTVELTFDSWSYYRPRTLEISSNYSFSKTNISTSHVPVKFILSLKKGRNEAIFNVPEGCDSPLDISKLGKSEGNDRRCLSVALTNFTISTLTTNNSSVQNMSIT